jgi:hypothetical protein
MLGFSLSKLLVLILIIAAVWYGFKWVGKLDKARKERMRGSGSGEGDNRDLVECPACATYVTARLEQCPEGRGDCPMLRS